MSAETIQSAKRSRRAQTDAESLIWHKIRNRQQGYKFRRQAPIGIYTVDFLCFELKLVIEIDGGQHAENEKDKIRTEFLSGLGYKVIRFWNNEVLDNIEGVLSTFALALSQREKEIEEKVMSANNDKSKLAPISDEELRLIIEGWERTTPGAWKSYVEGRDCESGSDFIMTKGEDIYLDGNRVADQDFIADAHQDIPRLVAEIQRLKALVKE